LLAPADQERIGGDEQRTAALLNEARERRGGPPSVLA
jgi:hypothetical protein